MYKRLIAIVFVLAALAITPQLAYAHPIDNSDAYFYFEKETDGAPLKDNEIKVYAYMNWFQAAMLVQSQLHIEPQDVTELVKHQDIYNKYIYDNIQVSNDGQHCETHIDNSPITDNQLLLSLGTRIIATYTCNSKINNIKIDNWMFLKELEFESNFTHILNNDVELHALTLDKNRTSYEFNAWDLKNHPLGDETVDNSANMTAQQVTEGLPADEQGIQVQANTNMSQVENPSAKAEPTATPMPLPTIDTGSNKPVVGPKEKGRSFLTALADSLFLKTTIVKDQSFLLLFALVFALGFLHTIEAGHSKAILASSMVHKKMGTKRGLGYALVFTLTHLGDIIIVGLIFLAADNYFNILSHVTLIEKFAGIALFFMSIYLLLRNLQYFLKKWMTKNKDLEMPDHIHYELDSELKFKDQLLLGFLAGLAPCVFGWSIFMLILSTNKIWILVPAILFFGLGIFAALAVVVFVMSHLQKRAYSRFEKIAEISPLISAVFLLIYAIFLVF